MKMYTANIDICVDEPIATPKDISCTQYDSNQFILFFRVKCHFRPRGLTSFATFVQRFVSPHLDPKGLKSSHFHPAR
ncbi:hypothetical protein Hanom_Chr10g00934321 [Helianthus anomalus]